MAATTTPPSPANTSRWCRPTSGSRSASPARCAPPAGGKYALLYVYPGLVFGDWGDNTATCGDWGWYVSVKEYSKLLVSLNSADHKVLSDCQLYDVENNPANNPVGFDMKRDSAGRRYLEKNGAQGQGNDTLQTTSVVIFLGHSGCTGKTPSLTHARPGGSALDRLHHRRSRRRKALRRS